MPNQLTHKELIDPQRPFPGLSSYEERNKAQFGGRDAEIAELMKMVENNTLTVVFGKSGIGKTSLLQAGLIPALQKGFYFPVYIRFDFTSPKPALQQLKDFIYEKLKLQDSSVPEFNELTLWEYFHQVKVMDGMVIPVIILDQFEETFTIGKEKEHDVLELIIELADLAENHVPIAVQQNPNRRLEIGSSNYVEQHYRVIISLREDYLAQLENLHKYLPSLNKNRFRVMQMSVMQALDAAIKPAGGLIDLDVAKAILKKFPGVIENDFDAPQEGQVGVSHLIIEPFLLSLICYQINEKRIDLQLPKFTFDLVSRFNVSDIILDYYDNTMKGFDKWVAEGIEDNLLTESGYRKLEALESIQTTYQIDEQTIQTLIDKRIIRKEERDGVNYIELIHDVLAPVIKSKRDKRILYEKEQEKNRAVEHAMLKERKNRNRLLFTIAGFLLTIILVRATYNYFENKRMQRLDYAQNLLTIADRILLYEGRSHEAALFARAAYLIQKENHGPLLSFYPELYHRLNDMRLDFICSQDTNSYDDAGKLAIKAIQMINGSIYSANANGKVFYTKWHDTLLYSSYLNRAPELLFSIEDIVPKTLKTKILSMASNPGNSMLAVSGTFNFVYLRHLTDPGQSKIIQLDSQLVSQKKYVSFMGEETLLIQSESKLYRYNLRENRFMIWPAYTIQSYRQNPGDRMKQSKLSVDQMVENNIVFNKEYLSIEDEEIHCIASKGNQVAIGLDTRICLFSNDTAIILNAPDLGSWSALHLDSAGNYLYAGNRSGELFRIDLSTYEIEMNSVLVGTISCIKAVKKSDTEYVAASLINGEIAIFKTQASEDKIKWVDLKAWYQRITLESKENQFNWKDITPLRLSPQRCKGEVFDLASICFDQSNNCVLGGYYDGSIRIWPISPDILAEEICKASDKSGEEPNQALMDSLIKARYNAQQLPIKSIGTYLCP